MKHELPPRIHAPNTPAPAPAPMPAVPMPVVRKTSDNRRLKAFRCPLSYVADQLVGYQGSADFFKVTRMAPVLPEGFSIVSVHFEHPRNDMYFIITHPSFPEIPSGDKLDAIDIMIEEIPVRMVKEEKPSFSDVLAEARKQIPSIVDKEVERAQNRNKRVAINLSAKMLLARSRAKGVQI